MNELEERKAELKRLREADDQWTSGKLVLLAAVTLAISFTIINFIAGFNGGH